MASKLSIFFAELKRLVKVLHRKHLARPIGN